MEVWWSKNASIFFYYPLLLQFEIIISTADNGKYNLDNWKENVEIY